MLVDPPDKWDKVSGRFYQVFKSVRDAEIRLKKQHPNPNYVACLVRLHQVHQLENSRFVLSLTTLSANGEINHDKTNFAIGGDVVQIVLDKGKQDI